MFSLAWFLGTVFESATTFVERIVLGKKRLNPFQVGFRAVFAIALWLITWAGVSLIGPRWLNVWIFVCFLIFVSLTDYVAKRRIKELKKEMKQGTGKGWYTPGED